MKRSHSPETIRPVKNTKSRSQAGTRSVLSSLTARVSPPPLKNDKSRSDKPASKAVGDEGSESLSLAAVEAGDLNVNDPVKLFTARLGAVVRPLSTSTEANRLSIKHWMDLYSRNQHEQGCHFVIHQHDHPIAGPHYDLRLQFSETSSVSWAIMYGLPGNPNSRRINRNATETRVHCLWNHLIETASRNTGSMIIWDTGEYEVLPYHAVEDSLETDDSASNMSNGSAKITINDGIPSESEKLKSAFHNRKIRLRLHGTRLPKNYTISLRLSVEDDHAARAEPMQRRRRRRRCIDFGTIKRVPTPSRSRSTSPNDTAGHLLHSVPIVEAKSDRDEIHGAHSESESERSTDGYVRLTNSYPGAVNSIGSIHQRRWFITLDRTNSGFVRDGKSKTWKRKLSPSSDQDLLGFEPFYVRGPESERSVVTGRTGKDVLEDENVQGFTPRRGWRAVVN